MRIHRLMLLLAVVSIVATGSAQPTQSFDIVFEPSSLTLIPGEPPQAVEIRLTRQAFAGPVVLSWEGGDHRVSRTGDAERRVRLWKVKAVVTIKKKEEEKPKKPCPVGACRILDVNGAADDKKRGTDWSCSWVPESGGGFIGSVPGADCQCACILPH